jgi:hypothetical protein
VARGRFGKAGIHIEVRQSARRIEQLWRMIRHLRAHTFNKNFSRSLMRSCAPKNDRFLFLSSGVTKRSALAVVCLRVYSGGTCARFDFVTSM